MSELKPCPFCGETLIEYNHPQGLSRHPDSNCMLEGIVIDATMFDAWNTRVSPLENEDK